MASIHHPPPSVGPVKQLFLGITKRNFIKARTDIIQGWGKRELWVTMGLQEIRQRYRRSKLGPFWITISMGVMVMALGTLYGTIFGQDLSDYLPYLSAGFVIWGFISGMILEGVSAFIQAEGLIKQLPAPLSIYIYRVAWTNLIIFGHNILIFFVVSIWYGKLPNLNLALAIPAIFILLLNGIWIGLLLGLLSGRFRDIPPIIGSLVQIMFFITPIIWNMDMLRGRTVVLDSNPFYYLVELLRAPLLGSIPTLSIMTGAILITIIGWTLTMIVYSALRWRLPYWV